MKDDKRRRIDLELGSKGSCGDEEHRQEASVNDQMRVACRKWKKLGISSSESRVVITSYGATRDEQDIIDEVKRRMSKYAVEVDIYRDGSKSVFLSR